MSKRGARTPGGRRGPLSGPAVIVFIIAVAFVGFAAVAIQRSSRSPQAAVPAAAPIPSGTPLVDASTVGETAFSVGDASAGGQGQPVDGVECSPGEMSQQHIHAHLSLFVDGRQLAIPARIGIVVQDPQHGCLYWLHTHDASGIVHIESPRMVGNFLLGQFFAIWGEPLRPNDVAGHRGSVSAFVGGKPYDGDLASIPLTAHEQITLEVGTPAVAPPLYAFPPGE